MQLMRLTSDEDLLAAVARDPDAFGAFYDRHHLTLLAAMRVRTGNTEVALDLTAEIFATALQGVSSFVSRGEGSAKAWLFGIARYKLIDLYRTGCAEDQARTALGMQPLVLTDRAVEALERRLDATRSGVLEALSELPEHEREAIEARVVGEAEYPDIARHLQVSESVVRQRVSRGLRKLRSSMEEHR